MNPALWIFPGGVAIGMVAGLLLGPIPRAAPDPPADAPHAPPRFHVDRDSAGDARNPHGRHRDRGARRSGGDLRTDLEELLLSLSTPQEMSELNLTDLVRRLSLLARLREDEALDVLSMLNQHALDGTFTNELDELASGIVFARLCELNGPAAMALLDDARFAKLIGSHQAELAGLGMNSWLAADPEGAKRWFSDALSRADAQVGSTGDDEELTGDLAALDHDALRAAYMNGMAKLDPESLEQAIARIGHEDARNDLRSEMLESLVRNEDSVEGLRTLLARAADAPEARLAAIAKLCEQDAEAARAWVEEQSPSPVRDQEITQVASAMMAADPDAGIEWYLSQRMTEDSHRSERLSRIVERLSSADPARAAEWLAGQPDTPTRDAAEASMAWSAVRRNDWEGSMEWLAGVGDPALREQSLNKAFQTGWNRAENTLRPEVLEAAEAAGFGEQARAFSPR